MIKFTKMHGAGNDYVYIDDTQANIKDGPKLAGLISNRHFGIGSDGLVLIASSQIADFKMNMFNYDGSEAEMCGNGIRCVGKFVYDKGLTNKTTITVETLAGIKTLDLNVKNGRVKSVRVDMGEPCFDIAKIPVNLDTQDEFPKAKLQVLDKEFEFHFVSVGNPHAITIIDNVKDFAVEKYGPHIETNSLFPNRTNVEFVELVDKNYIKMRVWERGSGETLACGTGAACSMAACCKQGLLERTAKVELLGGILEFYWDEQTNHIYMTGPAVTVFEGQLEEEFLINNL